MSALDKDWVGLQWRGEWSAETQYRVRDAVQYQGSSYIAGGSTAPALAEVPGSEGSSWEILAAAGDSDLMNMVTAEANLTSSQIVTGDGSRGVAAGGATIAEIRNAPSNKFARVMNESGKGGLAAGEVYLHQSPVDDQWSSVQYVEVGPLDSDGYRPQLRDAVGDLVGALLTVSGFDNVSNPIWATWTVASVVDDDGIKANVGSLVASSGDLGDLTERVTVSVLPLDTSDIDTPGSVGQVALFDANGKLNGTAMLVVSDEGDVLDIGDVSGAIIKIGDNTTPTITLGPSGGGGSVTVHSNATFNGALLSPGTGSNSTKIGSSANASGTNTIAIGNSATASGPNSISIGPTASGNGARCVYIGSGAGGGGGNEQIAIGNGAVVSKTDTIALGRGVSARHPSAVCIGRDASNNAASSTDTNDFVLGGAAHNYKFPGTIITDLRFRTTTGTKIGTGTDQLIGFWNATPVDQPDNLTAAGEDLGEVQALANGIRSLLIEVGLMAPDP